MLKKKKKKTYKVTKTRCKLFYFPFCFLGLVFCPIFSRKEIKTIKYRTEIKTKISHLLFRYLAEKNQNNKNRTEIKTKKKHRLEVKST